MARGVTDEAVKEDIMFCRICIQGLNGQVLWRAASAVRIVYKDREKLHMEGAICSRLSIEIYLQAIRRW